MLSAQVRRLDGIAVVAVSGEVDAHSARLFRDALAEGLSDGSRRLIADLAEVTFLDSSGLGVLVGKLKDVRQRGGSMHVVIANPRVLRVFEITGLDRVFRIHASLDPPLVALGGSPGTV